MTTIFLTAVHVIVCFVLILVILLQAGRGQGLTGPSFSSGNVQTLFGTRAADFLAKATSVSAICFIFTCLGLNYLEIKKSKSLMEVSGMPSQIDVDAIKKALEKVKKDSAAQTGAASETVNAVTPQAAQAEGETQGSAPTAAPITAQAPATPAPSDAAQTASK